VTTAADDLVCGIDEAGRGPWAGPVVAAAVILPATGAPKGLADSKKLSAPRRETLLAVIEANCDVGVGLADVEEIDRLNILQATFLAMRRAIAGLRTRPVHALVDGNRAPGLGIATTCIVKGDAKEPAISAASIVAKVHRDRIMAALDAEYPGYGWAHNAGYGTAEHRLALARLGVTPQHRRSYAPIKALLESVITN
jgi:ribonuclease HII